MVEKVQKDGLPIKYPDFGKRVTEEMKKNNISVTEVKNVLKVSYEMARRYSLGQALPRVEKQSALAQLLKTTAPYLMYGENQFDQLNSTTKNGFKSIPVVSHNDAAILFKTTSTIPSKLITETIPADLKLSNKAFCIVIQDNAMAPEFHEGDKIIVDPIISPQPGDFVVAKHTSTEVIFRKYRPRNITKNSVLFELIAINSDYPAINNKDHQLSIIGVMVEHRKYRKRN